MLAVVALDHAAVEIVCVDAERALREEPRVRIGPREARDVEDADVDGGNRHVRLLSSERRRLDRDRQIGLGLHLLRRFDGDIDLAIAAVHRHERFADRARGRDLLDGRAAAEHERGDVDIMALPVLRDRNLEYRAGSGVDVLRVEHVVGLDDEHARTGLRRRHRDFQRVARAIARLVERELDLVGPRFLAAVVAFQLQPAKNGSFVVSPVAGSESSMR